MARRACSAFCIFFFKFLIVFSNLFWESGKSDFFESYNCLFLANLIRDSIALHERSNEFRIQNEDFPALPGGGSGFRSGSVTQVGQQQTVGGFWRNNDFTLYFRRMVIRRIQQCTTV